jgi:hypothetical protein
MIFTARGHALSVAGDNTFALRSTTLSNNDAIVILSTLMQRDTMPADRATRVILAAYDLVRRIANGDVRLTHTSWGTMVTICAILGMPSMVGSSPTNPFPKPLPRMTAPDVWVGQFSGSLADWGDEDADTIAEIDALCDALCVD